MKNIINSICRLWVLVAGVLILSTSCNKLLDTVPTNEISSGTMWTTESLVDQGVIGVYYSLQHPVQSNGLIGTSTNIGYYGYEAFGMTGQGEYGLNNLFTSAVNPSNSYFSFQWKWFYDGIHRANDAIAHIPDAPMDADKKSRLVAECKVLRAFFYMRLNELYGKNGLGVPLYTTPINPDEANKPQSSESDVWNLVIQDLTDAIDEPNLPDNQIGGEGRVSKGAAYAFRGRAYLLTKQWDKAAADFAEVGEMGYSLFPDYRKLFKKENERCQEMILSVQYIEDPTGYGTAIQKYCAAFQQGAQDSRGCWTDLQVTPALVNLYEEVLDDNTVKPFKWEDYLPNWDKVSADGTANRKVFFIRDEKVNDEEIHPTITTAINSELNKLSATAKALYLPEGNEARIKEAYAHRDPRLAFNVVTPYANFEGVNSNSTAEGMYTYRFPVTGKYYVDQSGAEPNLNKNLPSTYYTSGCCNAQAEFKYIHRKFIGEGLEYMRREQNPVDEPIIRYADVLLMWAEALVEKNDLKGAMEKVKEVRDRVGIATIASSFADQNTARNYVRDERRRELVGEGVNFFDEMRWETLKDTKFSEKFSQNTWGGTESTGGTTYEWIGDQWYTWPVPKAEIELNKNLTPTPGWIY
ncbi:Starch-binding associating with outer membrane [Arachidicoccus rhizosphaerae]|uniref:Starch-binding associating with outer membrane n=1 Tax=Arachidicoccus rhizosphaerae TaxID=551991 RepID=A0A1H4AY15_9BACT|nr:RagB/SusD family nutrient uptake outer membrane protein [Arachidicoccus rhizosphaerae]SEA40755.1 Starch-binding associating with outer membrane [Arachidicoccus rhizosphaerae]